MIKNAYPLPCIYDLINTLKHSWYFTKLDIWWGYNNIRIKETDQWKALQTNGYVLWPVQLTTDLLGIHEPYLCWLPCRRMAHHLHGQPHGALGRFGRTHHVCLVSSSAFVWAQAWHEAGKMHLLYTPGRIPWVDCWRRTDFNGPYQA